MFFYQALILFGFCLLIFTLLASLNFLNINPLSHFLTLNTLFRSDRLNGINRRQINVPNPLSLIGTKNRTWLVAKDFFSILDAMINNTLRERGMAQKTQDNSKKLFLKKHHPIPWLF